MQGERRERGAASGQRAGKGEGRWRRQAEPQVWQRPQREPRESRRKPAHAANRPKRGQKKEGGHVPEGVARICHGEQQSHHWEERGRHGQ